MADLFLIAHKVRSEPAFDIACQMVCPECDGRGEEGGFVNTESGYQTDRCVECDGLGYWWMVPTSGHRAYPYWHNQMGGWPEMYGHNPTLMSPSLPDHYPIRTAPTTSLIDALGLRKPKAQAPTVPIARRF